MADEGFSDAERAAMQQRKAELREQAKGGKGAAKKEREAQACLDAIAALAGTDRTIAERLHAIVTEEAPGLDAKTWYGFPSYARDGKVLVFFQPGEKFGARYATLGFQDTASLDEGQLWPTSWAMTGIGRAEEEQIAALVRRAVG